MIEFNNVVKAFNGRRVIDGLSFTIEPGELFVIIGPSGTGKSVTLKLISGQITPTEGSVSLFGQDLAEQDTEGMEALRRKIGYLFQSGALLGWMSLEDNIALPLRERDKLPEAEIEQRVAQALAEVGLEHDGAKFPAEVSGGMQKRAGFARAMIERPEVLLFDEPTSGLDPVMSRTIDRLILQLNRKYHMTCVVVTHDLSGALYYADRIGMLKAGRLVALATPQELLQSDVPEVKAFLDAQFINRQTQLPPKAAQ